LRLVLGVGLGFFLAYLLFRDARWEDVAAAFRDSEPTWLLLSVALAAAGHLARVQRWTYAVRATHPASFRAVFSAAQAGLLLNVLLPLRAGEAGRVYVLAKTAGVKPVKSAALVAVDRIFDLLGLLPILFIALIGFPTGRVVTLPPGTLGNTEAISVAPVFVRSAATSALVLFVALVLVLVVAYARHARIVSVTDALLGRRWPRIATRVRDGIVGFSEGMHIFRAFGAMAAAIAFSLAAWTCGILSLTCTMRAFHVEFSPYVPFLMQAMIAAFVAAPVVPGLIGQFHVAVVISLIIGAPAVTPPLAKTVALTVHLIAVGMVLVLGIIGLMAAGTRISEVLERSEPGAREPLAGAAMGAGSDALSTDEGSR
jgi:uncharacterized protein (TIRG00374 family)